MKNKIVIFLAEDGRWFAKFLGEHAERITRINNGNDTIKTPWTYLSSPEYVQNRIRRFNPGAYVVHEIKI